MGRIVACLAARCEFESRQGRHLEIRSWDPVGRIAACLAAQCEFESRQERHLLFAGMCAEWYCSSLLSCRGNSITGSSPVVPANSKFYKLIPRRTQGASADC